MSNMAFQTNSECSSPTQAPGILEVMAAIATCQTALTSKIEEVQLDVGLLLQDLDKIRSRLAVAEQRVGHLEDTMGMHSNSV